MAEELIEKLGSDACQEMVIRHRFVITVKVV